MTDTNITDQPAVNSGTNQQSTDDKGVEIPDKGTNTDTEVWKQYGETPEDALQSLIKKASEWDDEKKNINAQFKEQLENKEDHILDRNDEIGRLRQGVQNQDLIKKTSEDFGAIFDGESGADKLSAVSKVTQWAMSEAQQSTNIARTAFYEAIEGDSEMSTKSFDWLLHQASRNNVSIDKLGNAKNMKVFLGHVKPQKKFDPVAEREIIRKEEREKIKTQNLAAGISGNSGKGQIEGQRVAGKDVSEMDENEFLNNFNVAVKPAFSF